MLWSARATVNACAVLSLRAELQWRSKPAVTRMSLMLRSDTFYCLLRVVKAWMHNKAVTTEMVVGQAIQASVTARLRMTGMQVDRPLHVSGCARGYVWCLI